MFDVVCSKIGENTPIYVASKKNVSSFSHFESIEAIASPFKYLNIIIGMWITKRNHIISYHTIAYHIIRQQAMANEMVMNRIHQPVVMENMILNYTYSLFISALRWNKIWKLIRENWHGIPYTFSLSACYIKIDGFGLRYFLINCVCILTKYFRHFTSNNPLYLGSRTLNYTQRNTHKP